MTRLRLFIALSGLILAAIACNTPGSTGPTINPPTQGPILQPTATLAAATLAPAGQPTAVIPPPIVPPNAPRRISFAAGATAAHLSGAIINGAAAIYLINAGKGQNMTVLVQVQTGQLALGVTSPSGAVMQALSADQASFQGQLPETGDYTLTLAPLGVQQATFNLDVTIPPLSSSGGGGATAQCWVSTATAIDALFESAPTADKFGTSTAGEKSLALARTKDGWLGFDPGVAQAGNQGRARLRWYPIVGAQLAFDPTGCDGKLPLVLSLQSVLNGTYHLMGLADAKFTDGTYENANYDPATSQLREARIADVRAFGDLNGDGAEDALIVTATNTGGSGTFVEIWPVLNSGGDAHPGGSLMVGDRTPVNSLSIDASGVITAEVLVDGPNDGACCPSVHQTWTIKLTSGTLVQQ